MKLWRFTDPCKYEYARASRVGSWEGEPPRRVRPLVMEWEPDSDVVGDFTWPGFDSDVVITDQVANVLRAARVPGFQLGPVEMRENSEAGKRRSKKPMVRLPYQGPRLWDLWVTTWTRIDMGRSTVTGERRTDGTLAYKVSGVQREETSWSQQRMELVRTMVPRREGEGLFVPPVRGIFRLEEVPAWAFCTDDVKRLIEQHGFTNVAFLEMGETVNASK